MSRWPRIEIHCGKGCGFNVVFLRQTNWNPHSHVKILPGTPEPVTTIWGPHFDANRWVELSSTVLFAPSQDNDPLETASSHEESSEDSESSEESSGGRESSEDDTTNVPSTTYSQTETRIQRIQDRIIQTQGMMSRMYRRYRAQNARREEADMNESLARIAPRGLLWQP